MLAPVGARLVEAERQDEADARALVHAGVQDLGEAVEAFGQGGRVERGDGDGRGGHGARDDHGAACAVQPHVAARPMEAACSILEQI